MHGEFCQQLSYVQSQTVKIVYMILNCFIIKSKYGNVYFRRVIIFLKLNIIPECGRRRPPIVGVNRVILICTKIMKLCNYLMKTFAGVPLLGIPTLGSSALEKLT